MSGGGGGGGGLKSRGKSYNFHVASRGSPLTLAYQQCVCVVGGGGGSCFNCSNKIIKNFLARLVFINETLIRPLNFSVCKSYSVLVV